MKRLFVVLVLVTLVSFNTGAAALAEDHQPVNGCPPPPFELHHIHEHDEHGHRHIGSDTDRNGDGYLCVKPLPGNKHLHIDNNVPFK